MNKLTIYKGNDLINANYKLSLSEQRLILSCIGQLKSNESLTSDMWIEVSVSDYAKAFNIDNKRAYIELKEIEKKLFERYVFIDAEALPKETRHNFNADHKIKTRWVSHVAYNAEEQKIAIGFAPLIIPYLSQLQKEFTKYKLEHVSQMSSIYAVRIYEILAQHQFKDKKEVTISLSDLREKLQLEDKYSLFGHFTSRVLVPAEKQINQYSNFTMQYDLIKKGRKVNAIRFKFSFKEGQEVTRDSKNNPWQHPTEKDIIEHARPGESHQQVRNRLVGHT